MGSHFHARYSSTASSHPTHKTMHSLTDTDPIDLQAADGTAIANDYKQLATANGRGTELITLTISPDTTLQSIKTRLQEEHASAEHIKTDRTRENVQKALKRLQTHLDQYVTTPESGMIAYAGVIDGELQSWCFTELPRDVPGTRYCCDSTFDVEVLTTVFAPTTQHGLLIIERGGALLARVVNGQVDVLAELESQVMGKTRAGGQSAQRFKRERERQLHEFFQRVAETVAREFTTNAETESITSKNVTIDNLAIGGTLGTAESFLDGDYLHHAIEDAVVGVYGVSDVNETGAQELLEKASADLLDERTKAQNRMLDVFFSGLRDESQPVVYGRGQVERALEFGAVDTLLVTPAAEKNAPGDFGARTEEQGGDVIRVTRSGGKSEQFHEVFKLAAVLRFPINE